MKKIALLVIASLLLIACNSKSPLDETISESEPSPDTMELLDDRDTPLFMTTMTHMEQDFIDDENENVFWLHVKQLRYAMDLADEYGAILTIETEQPFARANSIWGHNMMEEIMDRGHGVGTHCDIGGPNDILEFDKYVEKLKENKALVDELVGKENNHGCSGAGGSNDWVKGMSVAGFDYINGIVGMHLLALDQENRPDPTWDNRYIVNEGYHYSFPEDPTERSYLIKLKDLEDLEYDEDGILVVSNGETGSLYSQAEKKAAGREVYSLDFQLTKDDVDAFLETVLEVDENRDRTKVSKLAVYFPVSDFKEINEEILRYFFSEMQKLDEAGIIRWATQWEAVDFFLNWEN